MRKMPKYNDKNSRSSNHIWWMNIFDLTPDYWPCSLTVMPTKQEVVLNTIFILRTPDSRSGMKGITIRQLDKEWENCNQSNKGNHHD